MYYWEPFYYTFGDVSCGFNQWSSATDLVCVAEGKERRISFYISDDTVHLYSIDWVVVNYIGSVGLGKYSAILAWAPGGRMYAMSPAGIASDTARVSIPIAYRWSLSGAYNYSLTLSMKFIPYLWNWGPDWEVYNVTYVGKLELKYNGSLVAVDAFYGWYRVFVGGPPSGGGSASADATCVPTIIKTGEDQVHRDLNKGDNGYSVTVVNQATVRVAGCGADRTYTVTTYVKTITVDGTIYQVTDDKGNVCGYDLAESSNDGVVRCRHYVKKQSG